MWCSAACHDNYVTQGENIVRTVNSEEHKSPINRELEHLVNRVKQTMSIETDEQKKSVCKNSKRHFFFFLQVEQTLFSKPRPFKMT